MKNNIINKYLGFLLGIILIIFLSFDIKLSQQIIPLYFLFQLLTLISLRKYIEGMGLPYLYTLLIIFGEYAFYKDHYIYIGSGVLFILFSSAMLLIHERKSQKA